MLTLIFLFAKVILELQQLWAMHVPEQGQL